MLKCIYLLLFVLIMYTSSMEHDFENLKEFLRAGGRSKAEDDEWKYKEREYKLWPKFQYKKLYRDHVYTEMSPATKELFFAVGVHKSCNEKKGQCIRRDKCVAKKMLYLSRVCYKHDLVCCYEDYPPIDYEHLIIRPKEYPDNKSKEADEEKEADKGKEAEKDKETDKGKAADKGKESEKDKETDKGKEAEKDKETDKGKAADKGKEAADKDTKPDKGNDKKEGNNPAPPNNTRLLRHKKKFLRIDSEEDPLNDSNSTMTALLLPKDNNSTEWSWWLVHDVTKQEILAKINPSIKLHEVNLSKVLSDIPEMTAFLDNIPPEPNSTLAQGEHKPSIENFDKGNSTNGTTERTEV